MTIDEAIKVAEKEMSGGQEFINLRTDRCLALLKLAQALDNTVAEWGPQHEALVKARAAVDEALK